MMYTARWATPLPSPREESSSLREFTIPKQPSWVFVVGDVTYAKLEDAIAARRPLTPIYCRLRESLEKAE